MLWSVFTDLSGSEEGSGSDSISSHLPSPLPPQGMSGSLSSSGLRTPLSHTSSLTLLCGLSGSLLASYSDIIMWPWSLGVSLGVGEERPEICT